MIKPNSICMIRGVPKTKPGYEFNGTIVRAVERKPNRPVPVWLIDPPLKTQAKVFTGCAEQWLHPLDDFEPELTREALDRALEHV